MDCTTGLLVVAVAGLILMTIGICAAPRQVKWMAKGIKKAVPHVGPEMAILSVKD